MIRSAIATETGALVALGEATGIFGAGEADALLRGTLDALHAGDLGKGHEVRVWADPADGAPGGWVYFGPRDGEEHAWELYWIGVAPVRHGQGIGDALMRFVERHVAAAGGTVLTIETSSLPALERARRFYRRGGYAVRSVSPNHYGDGDDRVTFVKTLKAEDDERTPIAFVRAEAHHLIELVALVDAYYTFDGIAFDAESVRRGLTVLLTDSSYGGAWLIRDRSETAGYFVLTYGFDIEFGGRQATLTELYLRPESRGRGLGQDALRFIEAHLRAAGIGAYELQVDRDNARARAFYAAAGFEVHDRIPLSKRVPARE
jgi:ribosomal protein S18 acetylase RimI-like enzyme